MKQLMKIIGVRVVNVTPDETEGVVELRLAPIEMVKKKPKSIMELAMGGDMSSLFGEVNDLQHRENTVFISLKQYLNEFKNQPLSNIWLELSVAQLAEDISKGGK